MFLADMGEREEGMSINRINPFRNYTPGNCRWATDEQQQRNKRANCKRRRGVRVPSREGSWDAQACA